MMYAKSQLERNDQLKAVYEKAKAACVEHGYGGETEWVKQRRFEDVTYPYFLAEYIYVVLNTGMKNQVAEKIFRRFQESGTDLSVIRHKSKRKAIEDALAVGEDWWSHIKAMHEKLPTWQTVNYLDSLPFIGPVTKYHLARNIGLDVAKPDRHLVRLADKLGFSDVQEMCHRIASITGERVGVVDVVLWRALNLGVNIT